MPPVGGPNGYWLIVHDRRFGLDYEISSHCDYSDVLSAFASPYRPCTQAARELGSALKPTLGAAWPWWNGEMWWGIGVALLLMVHLLGFYIFVAIRLLAIRAGAPIGAKRFLSTATRAALASASQKLGIIAILLFLGIRQDEAALKANLVWIVLLVAAPTGWMILAALQQRRAKSELDAEARVFVASLNGVPVLPWKRSV